MNRLVPIALTIILGIPCAAYAEAYRYIDEAGNIYFVDSINDIPRRYRSQVVPPTPTPVLNRQQRINTIRQERDKMRQAEREHKKKQRERENLERRIRIRKAEQARTPQPEHTPEPVDQDPGAKK